MILTLVNDKVRQRTKDLIDMAPEGYVVRIDEPTRNLEQNARLWACLQEISAQVVWHGRRLATEEWKHIFSAALTKQDVVPNLDGTGFVILGKSTSKMSKREMSDMLQLIETFGAERGVKFET